METVNQISGSQLFKKDSILTNVTDFLMEINFFLHFSEITASFFFPSSRKLYFKEILISAEWKRSLVLMMVSASRKKAANKRILFPIDRNSDSTSQNKGFVKNMRFHCAEKLLSLAGISRKTRKKWLPIVGERLLYKKWLHLNLNNGFH